MHAILKSSFGLCGIAFAASLLLGRALAQNEGPAAPQDLGQNPQLTAQDYFSRPGKEETVALRIAKFDLAVALTGDVARTTLTVHFDNPSQRALEGDFTFDMPAGSLVTGYALDIDGKMVPGVLVSQRKAKLAYQAIVRRELDPGLAEITRTNAFRTRIFPILEKKGRTVRLEFVTPLDRERAFSLPLGVKQAIGLASIRVTASGTKTQPVLTGPGGIALQWRRTAAGYEAQGSAENVPFAGKLEIGSAAPQNALLMGTDRNGERFFEINDVIERKAAPERHVERLRVYWDTSRSRRDNDLKAERALLGAYLEQAKPRAVELVLFADGTPQLRSFTAAAEVLAALDGLDYQGATSFSSIMKANYPTSPDACLIFTDGNNTIDSLPNLRRRGMTGGCPLFAITSAADANLPLLSLLAEYSGGEAIPLGAMSPETALARLSSNTPRVVDVTANGHDDVSYALLPSGRGGFRIVGHAPKDGDIVVKFSRGRDRTYRPHASARADGNAIAALWARHRIAELKAAERPDPERAAEVARRYSVASEDASFIVLENIEDYAQAGIVPPVELGAKAMADYRARATEIADEKAERQAGRLKEVIAAWEEQKNWWGTTFDPNAKKPTLQKARANMQPPPASAAPPPEPANLMSETIVVTGARTPQQGLYSSSPVTALAQQDADALIEIAAEPWKSDRPYMKALSAAAPGDFWNVYKAQERQYGTLPIFYLDVSEFLFRRGQTKDAIVVVTNALELPTTTGTTLTILAERLMRYGAQERAVWLYERILFLEPDRPQPRRDLALALIARADRRAGDPGAYAARKTDYLRALDLLNEIVTHVWSDAYDGVELIALMEANRIVPQLRSMGVSDPALDKRLIARLDVDIRVVLEWNTDITDMDLWVDEPSGERAIYSHPRTSIGGRLSNDMTAGYGPEEYLLHRAPGGTYTIKANVYATDRLDPNGPVTIRVHLFRNYARAGEQEQVLEVELQPSEQGERLLGTIKVAK